MGETVNVTLGVFNGILRTPLTFSGIPSSNSSQYSWEYNLLNGAEVLVSQSGTGNSSISYSYTIPAGTYVGTLSVRMTGSWLILSNCSSFSVSVVRLIKN